LNIAITSDPSIPVPPETYGGIERIIDLLIKNFLAKGHSVTLFAHRDSQVTSKLIPYRSSSHAISAAFSNGWQINKTILKGQYDIIHCFGRMAYILPLLPSAIPKLISYQREPTIKQIKRAVRLSRSGTLAFTGCSDYITDQILPHAAAFTIYNAIDLSKYQANYLVSENAPLVFLGRVEQIKGTHLAIEIAIKSERKLIIAGNIPSGQQGYFENYIRPHLGEQIQYVGAINDQQKARLLQNACAMLMPIQWNEPFGIVMIEAMACGTPVLGIGHGAVPEVVRHGISGFIGHTAKDLAAQVKSIHQLDRTLVRKHVEEKFSSDKIANQYLQLYHRLIRLRIDGEK
jgi:glycosyltransferase involved in cell wall biosynthesis